MATKSLFTPALLALKKTEITTNASTLVFVRHLQQNAKKNNVAPSATASPAMGRAGYDTTNMKVATRPRLANKGTDKSDTHSAKHHASVSQQQQRGEGVGGTSDGALGKAQASEKNARFHYKIPTGREVEGYNPVDDDLPITPLVGRGWTFWL